MLPNISLCVGNGPWYLEKYDMSLRTCAREGQANLQKYEKNL